MEVDYRYLTPEQRELYCIDNIPWNLSMTGEDEHIDASQQTLGYDNIDFIAHDLNKRSRYKKSTVSYMQYASSLTIDDNPKKHGTDTLIVRCKYCKKHFKPNCHSVENRIRALNGEFSTGSEYNFYCSTECKKKCPSYKSHGAIKANSKRDAAYSKQAKEIALELADNRCEICGSEDNLECHHIIPVKVSPVESFDVDNIIILCDSCHKKRGHSDRECTTGHLANC